MGSYCNLVKERAAIMDEQAALLEQCAGDMYAIIELCDEIKHKLEELEEKENEHDKQANMGPPLYLSGSHRYIHAASIVDEDYPMDMDVDMDVSLEYFEANCFHYGDDSPDTDDANAPASNRHNDSEDTIHCMNAQLKEHFCSRRGCSWLGGCRVSDF